MAPVQNPGSYQTPHQAPQQPPPNNWLIPAIISTFCCLPMGVVGIIFATQVNSKWMMGDYEGAMSAANNAKTFSLIGFGLWALGVIAYIIVIAVAVSQSPEFQQGY